MALIVGFICVLIAVYWAYHREYGVVSITLLALVTAFLWPLVIPLILETERKRGDWGKIEIKKSYKESDYEEDEIANDSADTNDGKKNPRSGRVKVSRSSEHL